MLMVTRQLGIILGPLLIFFTDKWDFYLFGFAIDDTNSAGLMIAILWTLTLFYNLIIGSSEPMARSKEQYIVENDEELTEIISPDKKSENNNHQELSKTTSDYKWRQVTKSQPI